VHCHSNSMTEDEATNAFYKLMYQHVSLRIDGLKAENRKIAHYTSAENAMNIIIGKTIWLRNASLMNDFMEIQYGRDRLSAVLKKRQDEITTLLNRAHDGLSADVTDWLEQVDSILKEQTYLTSFAEHPADDKLGKLSMWRAYGGSVAGVALVFNTDLFESDHHINSLATSLHPVIYGPEQFATCFDNLISELQCNSNLLRQVPLDRAKSIVFHTFKDLVLTTKHPGFAEEEEWRIIHSPFMFSSAFVMPSTQTIGGVPQVIHEIQLRNQGGLNLPEIELDRLIHRVIIGPCQYPAQVAFALAEALTSAGVANSRSRINISDIPVRQRG
jgi:hypothetical protein